MAEALDTTMQDDAAQAAETPETNEEADKATVQAERNARKAQKRVDWREWRPSENAAVLSENIMIGHPQLRRLFDLVFIRGQIASFMLQSKISRSGVEEEARANVEEILESMLQKIEKELAAERARLIEFAKGDGITEFPAKSYVVMEDLEVKKYSPGAGRLLRIFRGLDDIFWMLEVLFMNGTIKLSHKTNVVNRWKREMWQLVRTQTNTWVTVRDAIRDGGRIRKRGPEGKKPAGDDVAADLSNAA